jgi:hypothetical protein
VKTTKPSSAIPTAPVIKIGSVAGVTTNICVPHNIAVSHRPIVRAFIVLLLQGMFSKANQDLFHLIVMILIEIKRIHAVSRI